MREIWVLLWLARNLILERLPFYFLCCLVDKAIYCKSYRRTSWNDTTPLNRYLQLAKIKKIQKERNINDDEINTSEFADYLNTKEDYVNDILKASKSYVSLDNPVAHDKKEIKLEDVLLDKKNKEPVESLYERDLKDVINATLMTLTEREQLILKHRFGLDNHEELSLSEIGKMFNLTKERIRR
jgi:RNA polymerase primary sigma factor